VGGDAALLENMAKVTGGKMHYTLDGNQLGLAFASIAADCTITGTLVQRFAEILSKEISVKIIVDYL
ncbi:unnamed protein product, partial [Didymodactylos carnosus]